LREEQFAAMRHRIYAVRLNANDAQKQELDEVHEAYIKAKTRFSIIDNGENLANVVGTSARINRIIWQIEGSGK